MIPKRKFCSNITHRRTYFYTIKGSEKLEVADFLYRWTKPSNKETILVNIKQNACLTDYCAWLFHRVPA